MGVRKGKIKSSYIGYISLAVFLKKVGYRMNKTKIKGRGPIVKGCQVGSFDTGENTYLAINRKDLTAFC